MLVQPLPFEIELKKFVVEYYETGMPKRFASDIVIHDPREKVAKPFTIEVNHPVEHRGIRVPSMMDVDSVIRGLRFFVKPIWKVVIQEIEAGYTAGRPAFLTKP